MEVPKYMRLHSISRPQCNSQLALNGHGRAAITISLLASVLLGAIFSAVTGYEIIIVIAIIAGLVIGSITGSKYGVLFVCEEKSGE